MRYLGIGFGVLLMATGVTMTVHDRVGQADPEADQAPTMVVPTVEPTVPPAPSITPPTAVAAKPVVPTGILIPSMDIAAVVTPIRSAGSVLTPPDDPRMLGWWADGAKPGSSEGAVLLTGHTVHTGGGALDDLEKAERGAVVTVVAAPRREIRYEVRSVEIMSKDELAKVAPELFATTGRPRLVLVTCEDYDTATGEYDSNVVLVAEPVA